MSTEFLDFQPFGCVPAVLLCRVTGHARRTFGGIGPAFGALKSDNDPDALVFGHKGRSAAIAIRVLISNPTSQYTLLTKSHVGFVGLDQFTADR